MKKQGKILLLIVLLIIFPLTFYVITNLRTGIGPSAQLEPSSTQSIDLNQELYKYDTFKFTYSAWIPAWGSSSGLESLKQNSEQFQIISPVWYEVNSDGSLINKSPTIKDEMLRLLHEKEVAIIPAIAMFDHELFTKVLQNQDNLDRHIANIIKEVESNDFDGIDLDYESTKLTDKIKYFELLSRLSENLHKNNKKLIVTVIAKWGDDITYPSLIETRQVQDWSEISKYADEIRIMAYDYTFAKSMFPGPIAPVNWVQEVLDYAITKAEPQKFILGIHLYSYEWRSTIEDKLPFIPGLKDNSNGNNSAVSYTYSQVKNIIASNQGIHFNYESEQIFEYFKDGKSRTLVYIDPLGIKERIELAQEYNLGGVVFWRLGGEADLLSNLGILD